MTAKKWLWMFVLTALAMAILLGLFNILTDPFGVFGDPVMHWYSADITNNPRTAKITYLDRHFDEYDSYIVGCSSTSSFPKEAFDRYFGASFYNMIVYGADLLDSEQMIDYLIAHDDVKNIVLNLYIDNGVVYDEESDPYTHCMPAKLNGSDPVAYYARFLTANPEYGIAKIRHWKKRTWLSQSFCIFDEASGAYDKRRRDAEPISDMESYLQAYPVFADYPGGSYTMPAIDKCLESLGRIKETCDQNGVKLTVVTAPVYWEYLNVFNMDDVKRFWTGVAEITDFWDFSYTSVSFEPRYFYDGTHFRNNVGEMAAARMFGDDSVWMPEDFGHYVTAETVEEYLKTYDSACAMEAQDYTAQVPVLMYHSITDEIENDMTVTAAAFREQIETLCEAGYTAVSLTELYDYVMNGGELPEKPVVITFDDGYRDNYENAFPILKEFGMKAAVFVIGSQLGQDTYKGLGEHPIRPHLTADQMKEMADSGLIEFGSHTYDLHRYVEWEENGDYETMAQPAGVSETDYLDVLRTDMKAERELLYDKIGREAAALAFPQGKYSDNIQAVSKEEGIRMTFSTRSGSQTLIRGLEQSLYAIRRIYVGELTGAELLEKLKS